MFASFASLIMVALIFLAATALGAPIVRGLGIPMNDRLERLVWSVAVGLIFAAMGIVLLGHLGLLHAGLLIVLTPLGALLGLGVLVRSMPGDDDGNPTATEVDGLETAPATVWQRPPRWVKWLAGLLAVVVCVGSLVGALAPPTAGDALCYHLELPKAFLAAGRIEFLPDSDNSTFPLLVEIWYLWGLAAGGPTAPAVIHWALGILLALSAVLLATPVLGRPWAWIVGALVLLVPGVNNQMAAPMNDLGLALFTTLSFVAWRRAVWDGLGRRWFLLAGIAAGGALGTKYLALGFALAMGATCLWAYFTRPRVRRLILEGAAVAAVVAVSTGGYWYVRAAWYRGNPVYPFLEEIVQAEDAPGAEKPRQTLPASKSRLGRSLSGLAAAPWQITMRPERFGGRGHQLGIVFLAVLPGALMTRRLRGLGPIAVCAGAYFLVWFLLRQNVRFLLPAVPLLAVVVVWVWVETARLPRVSRGIVVVVLAVAMTAMGWVGLGRGEGCWAVALGGESREHFLMEHEPSWRAARWVREMAAADDRLLTQDYRAFHFPCRVTRENLFRRRTAYDRQIQRPTDLSRRLREEGFRFLLLAENEVDRGIQYDPTLSRLADAELAAESEALVPLDEYVFDDSDGGRRRYRLLLVR